MSSSKANNTPLESTEQKTLVAWLELQGLLFTAIPNSTYTTSWAVKRRNYEQGLRKGLPDLLIVIPPERAVDGTGRVIFCEMKRKKAGVVSPEQKKWIAALNAVGGTVDAFVAHGADEAIEEIARVIGVGVDNSIF